MLSAAYEWHNYGKSTIGNRTDIERVPIDSLQAFYKKYYRPDNAMLIVAGKFDEAKALDLIAEELRRDQEPGRPAAARPTPRSRRRTASGSSCCAGSARVGATGAVYHIPAGADPEFPAVEVLDSVLDDRAGRPAVQGPGRDQEGAAA